jgi:hypothetical protein
LAFARLPSKASGVVLMARGGAAAIFAVGGFGAGGGFPLGGRGGACWTGVGIRTAVGGFCTSGGFPSDGGGGACWVGTCTDAEEGGMELVYTSGVDKLVALNEGPAISPADGCLCFPFPVVVGKEPESADTGLVCSKTEPVCGVRG